MSDIENKYKSLTPIEHILLRPGMYIGSVVTEDAEKYIFDESINKFKLKTIRYNAGFIKLFDEIISNSVDESKRTGTKLNTIKVEVSQSKGEIIVYDNGGIPVEIHKKEKKYIPEMCFASPMSGSNFNDTENREGVGTHGIGSSAVAIFSKIFKVETADGKNKFVQIYKNNLSNKSKPEISSTRVGFTRITYIPDFSRFDMSCIDDDSFKLIESRVYEVAGTNPNLKIYFNGKNISIKSFYDYCKMFIDDTELIYDETKDKKWCVGIAPSYNGFQNISFCNGLFTYVGGSHLDYILNQIIPPIRQLINKKYKTDILPGQIKNHIMLFVNASVSNPKFSSQTKERMISEKDSFINPITLSNKFIEKICKCDIVNLISDWLEQKKLADEKKAERDVNKEITRVKVDKLIDCKWAGTDRKSECRLILTEGDSAISSFRKFRNPNTEAGLALKGKSLNVRDLSKSKVMENVEIRAVMAAMGLKFGESPIKFSSDGKVICDKTRFGELHIYTDADVDGSACAALILNYIHKFWPDLLRCHKIARVETPILIAESRKNKKETWFYYDSEYREWLKTHNVDEYEIHYLKGLGSLNDKQSKEIIQNPHLYYYELDDEAEQNMNIWFGKDSTPRKMKLT